MRNFDFYSPTYFVFGKDREAETGRYVKRFGGSRVLVVYGGQSAKRSGLLDRIMACLTAVEREWTNSSAKSTKGR